MEKVYDFLKKAGVYYLATEEGDQPQLRPFGTIDLFEGKLYIQTGRVKAVYRQICENPRAAICAFSQGTTLRVTATLREDTRLEAERHMLDAYPSLKERYAPGDGNNVVLALTDAEAVFSTFAGPSETVRF